ncbi:hypothetical protein CEE44_01590 [Candidatus Woesearchaeota archaeon B3_Woes]|nr:MAG: hypothetical protein CEE44_01590 [Candidatus Woesearchaeota archaeon B3_Woes]
MKYFSIQKIIFVIFILILLILIGCSRECPKSCDDNDECTDDFCADETKFKCINLLIVPCIGDGKCEEGEYPSEDCPNCDDNNSCTRDDYDYSIPSCKYTRVTCLGDGRCEEGEYPSGDCPNCDDNDACTEDIYDFSTSLCKNIKIINCLGNGICEKGEYPSKDCPTCDDNDKCTEDYYDFSLGNCSKKPINPCCGNGVCEEGENYSACSVDCDMTKDEAVADCKEEHLDIIEICLTDAAIKYEDYEVCDEINETKERLMTYTTTLIDRCVKTVAISLKNEKICEKISDQADDEPDDCYRNVAVTKGDYELCTKSGFVKYKTVDCFKDVYVSLGGRSYSGAVCGGLKTDYYNLCMAVINSNNDYCEYISDTNIREECVSNS